MSSDTDGTVSWRELYDEAVARFAGAGVDEPETSARRIVEECSGYEGAEFALGLGQLATIRGVASFDERVARRLGGEPIQYVVGSWGFRTLDLFIDQRVLIPRPETEIVAGLAIAELRRMKGVASPLTVLDLGTGSGAIGLSIAVEVPNVEVWLTDVSDDALTVARANIAGLGRAGSKIRTALGAWFQPVPSDLETTIAVIVSNPPYIADSEPLADGVKRWEPAGALFSGPTGTEDLEHLVIESGRWLRHDGALVLEMAPWQTEPIADLARRRFAEVEIEADLSGRARSVIARKPLRP